MVNGRADMPLRLATGGFQRVTVSDVSNPSRTGSSTQVRAISSGFHLVASVDPPTARAGDLFTLTVKVTNDAGAVISEINSSVTIEVQQREQPCDRARDPLDAAVPAAGRPALDLRDVHVQPSRSSWWRATTRERARDEQSDHDRPGPAEPGRARLEPELGGRQQARHADRARDGRSTGTASRISRSRSRSCPEPGP